MDGAPSWHDAAVPSGETDGNVDPDAVLAQGPQWPALDLSLRAVVELDLALDTDVPVDAAHAVVSDLADRAFGAGWQRWYTEALDAEGLGDDAGRLLRQDDVAERVLERLRARARDDDGAPDPPGDEYGWYAYAPGTSPGRARFRRTVGDRRRNARAALLLPRRHRVAGRRRDWDRPARPGARPRRGAPWRGCPAAARPPRPSRSAPAGRGAPNG